MSGTVQSGTLRDLGVERAGNRAALYFFAALAGATLLPIALLPLYDVGHRTPLTYGIIAAWGLAGYGHVISTFWFGTDPAYHSVISHNRLRMIGSLAIVPAIFAAVALSSAPVSAWLFSAYLAWQMHHFNRQNYGILSLAAARDGLGPLPRGVSVIVALTTVAAVSRVLTLADVYPGLNMPTYMKSSAMVAAGLYVAIAAFGSALLTLFFLVVTNAPLRRSPTVLGFLCLTTVFFLPGLLPGPAPVAFWPFAMAHGFQYLIISGATARQSGRGWAGLALFTTIAMLGGAAGLIKGVPWWQIYAGVVIWHFLVDARLWRLRDPEVAAIVRSRLGFALDR